MNHQSFQRVSLKGFENLPVVFKNAEVQDDERNPSTGRILVWLCDYLWDGAGISGSRAIKTARNPSRTHPADQAQASIFMYQARVIH